MATEHKQPKKPDLTRLSDKHLEELASAVTAEQRKRDKEKAKNKKPHEMSDAEFEAHKVKLFSKDEDDGE